MTIAIIAIIIMILIIAIRIRFMLIEINRLVSHISQINGRLEIIELAVFKN